MEPSAQRKADTISEEPLPHEGVRFAHNSERQFAKLLDFYGIEWQYEPRTFVLATDREGNPQEAFAPDFYLPAYDLFIEITTLNQKLVTKKNRKVRKLRERFPGTKVKIFYQRDYLRLLVKYGLEPPSQHLPGHGGDDIAEQAAADAAEHIAADAAEHAAEDVAELRFDDAGTGGDTGRHDDAGRAASQRRRDAS